MDESLYHEGMRRLQDLRETRALADRLEQVTVRGAFTPEDRAFLEGASMFFLATADAAGRPDCSYRGGVPGFVHVLDEQTLAFPDYDGNGMYRSLGNALVNPHVGMLFVDFASSRRLRVNGAATIDPDDPLRDGFPGAVFVVRVRATHIFPNCPRYLHPPQSGDYSVHAPRDGHTPPPAAWKQFEVFRDALPERDRLDGPGEGDGD